MYLAWMILDQPSQSPLILPLDLASPSENSASLESFTQLVDKLFLAVMKLNQQTAVPSNLSPAETAMKAFLIKASRTETMNTLAENPQLRDMLGMFYMSYDIRQRLQTSMTHYDEVLTDMLRTLMKNDAEEAFRYLRNPVPESASSSLSPPRVTSDPETPKETSSPRTSSSTKRHTTAAPSPKRSSLRKGPSKAAVIPPLRRRSATVIDLTTPSPSTSRQGTPARRMTPRGSTPFPDLRTGYPRHMHDSYCFGCAAKGHFQSWCPDFVCETCQRRQPRHYPRDCPEGGYGDDDGSYVDQFDYPEAEANITGEPIRD
jgi:hypothetical protein